MLLIIMAGCSTTNKIIAASENSITIKPRHTFHATDRLIAASETAIEHCDKFGKSAVYDFDSNDGNYEVVTFRCE